jgi:hypothetical protein
MGNLRRIASTPLRAGASLVSSSPLGITIRALSSPAKQVFPTVPWCVVRASEARTRGPATRPAAPLGDGGTGGRGDQSRPVSQSPSLPVSQSPSLPVSPSPSPPSPRLPVSHLVGIRQEQSLPPHHQSYNRIHKCWPYREQGVSGDGETTSPARESPHIAKAQDPQTRRGRTSPSVSGDQ